MMSLNHVIISTDSESSAFDLYKDLLFKQNIKEQFILFFLQALTSLPLSRYLTDAAFLSDGLKIAATAMNARRTAMPSCAGSTHNQVRRTIGHTNARQQNVKKLSERSKDANGENYVVLTGKLLSRFYEI